MRLGTANGANRAVCGRGCPSRPTLCTRCASRLPQERVLASGAPAALFTCKLHWVVFLLFLTIFFDLSTMSYSRVAAVTRVCAAATCGNSFDANEAVGRDFCSEECKSAGAAPRPTMDLTSRAMRDRLAKVREPACRALHSCCPASHLEPITDGYRHYSCHRVRQATDTTSRGWLSAAAAIQTSSERPVVVSTTAPTPLSAPLSMFIRLTRMVR